MNFSFFGKRINGNDFPSRARCIAEQPLTETKDRNEKSNITFPFVSFPSKDEIHVKE